LIFFFGPHFFFDILRYFVKLGESEPDHEPWMDGAWTGHFSPKQSFPSEKTNFSMANWNENLTCRMDGV
jgi:hypothetical protein